MQLETRVHRCLAEGRPALGLTGHMNSPLGMELLARNAEFDWVMFEMQHSPLNMDNVTHVLRALQSVDVQATPIARPPSHHHFWIEQFLDAGFTGLIIPQVESAEQAGEIATAARFPTAGARSFGGSVRAVTVYDNYTAEIDKHLILLPQIESKAGLDNYEAIINEPGISGVLLGPGDLAMSCGWPMGSMWTHPPFTDAIKRVGEACRAAGKIACTLMSGDGAKRVIDMGYQMVGLMSDGVHIRTAMATDYKNQVRSLGGK